MQPSFWGGYECRLPEITSRENPGDVSRSAEFQPCDYYLDIFTFTVCNQVFFYNQQSLNLKLFQYIIILICLFNKTLDIHRPKKIERKKQNKND